MEYTCNVLSSFQFSHLSPPHSFATALFLKLASIVRFVILQVHKLSWPPSPTNGTCSPGMFDNCWSFSGANNFGSLTDWNVITFSRTHKYLVCPRNQWGVDINHPAIIIPDAVARSSHPPLATSSVTAYEPTDILYLDNTDLSPMSQPTHNTRHGKQNWEEIKREACPMCYFKRYATSAKFLPTHGSIDKATRNPSII